MDEGSLALIARHVLDGLAAGCQVVSHDYRYLYVNDAVAGQAHRAKEDLLGRTMMECFPGIEGTAMFSTLRRCLQERGSAQMENEFSHADGTKGWFDLRFFPVPDGVFILSLDVTADKQAAESLRRAEEQLRHLQKMEAVSRLAGGVAHDFNNVLSIVLSYSEMAIADLSPDHTVQSDLREIVAAGKRASELTRQLLTLSRRQIVEPRLLDINELLRGMYKMLKRLLGEDVDVVVATAPAVGKVLADISQLEQVVMNLVVNARDAMPRGGKLTIETADAHLDEEYAREHLGVEPGSYVMLAVSDTGIGMDEATRSRIFEPFFTTKEPGRGTGLGLSMVFGIVKQSGGHIWVYSEPGRGSTFKVYLPHANEAAAIVGADNAAKPRAAGGTETILLVEDDPQVRVLVFTVLRRLGYQVLVASDGADALAICEEHEGAIQLVLTDVVLPQMSGPELFARVTKLRPETRVLYMSGYTGEAVKHHGVIEAGVPFMQKPLTPDVVAAKVRAVLDALA